MRWLLWRPMVLCLPTTNGDTHRFVSMLRYLGLSLFIYTSLLLANVQSTYVYLLLFSVRVTRMVYVKASRTIVTVDPIYVRAIT